MKKLAKMETRLAEKRAMKSGDGDEWVEAPTAAAASSASASNGRRSSRYAAADDDDHRRRRGSSVDDDDDRRRQGSYRTERDRDYHSGREYHHRDSARDRGGREQSDEDQVAAMRRARLYRQEMMRGRDGRGGLALEETERYDY